MDQWEIVYEEAKDLNLSLAESPQPQYDFLFTVRPLNETWVTTYLVGLAADLENGGDVPDLSRYIKEFRQYHRLSEIFSKNSNDIDENTNSSSAFATSGQENRIAQSSPSSIHKGRNQQGEKVCLCGFKHLYEKCFYINFEGTNRSTGFKYRQEIFDKINKKLAPNNMERLRSTLKSKFDYDMNATPLKAMSSEFSGCSQQLTDMEDQRNSLGTFTTHLENPDTGVSFLTTEHKLSKRFHLHDHWVLDGGSDVHICNNEKLHGFQSTDIPVKDHYVVSGTTKYPVKSWGTCKVSISTPEGERCIVLSKVALIPGFMTSLVSLHLMSIKGVHWSSMNPYRMTYPDGAFFCELYQSGMHWTFEKDPIKLKFSKYSRAAFSGTNSNLKRNQTRHKTVDKATLHRIFGHASPEVVNHIAGAARDGSITVLDTTQAPSTVECEICAISKAHQIISRIPDKDHPQTKPFERITVDLIPMKEAFNSNTQIIHFQCGMTLFNMIFTMYSKIESPKYTRKVLELIKSMGHKVKYIHLDGESSLRKSLEEISIDYGLKIERTAPRTPEQNGQSEVNGRWIILKARALSIEARLPQNLWPQLVLTAGYLMNRTPSRKLSWKTPFECVYGYKPPLSHLDIIGSRVYALKKNIPRLDKLLARAHIGYLVGWESTNVYKIWVPSLGKIINTRDVKIQSGKFFDPQDLDAVAIKEATEDEIIQALEWPSIEEEIILNDANDEWIEQEDLVPSHPLPVKKEEDIIPGSKLDSDTKRLPGIFPDDTSNRPSYLAMDGSRELARAKGNHAKNAALINPDIDPQNILSKRTRNSTKMAQFAQYYLAFSSANINSKYLTRPTRENLPPVPKGWDKMLRHQFSTEFLKAAEKEFIALEEKQTWEYLRQENVPKDFKIIPVVWIFSYKFDQDGFLEKFKARLCARGDLLDSDEDPYAATLASQSFRAMMAITAAHDLEIQQYDVVNAFVNAPIRGEVYCHCPKGFEKVINGKRAILKLRKALYGFRFSPLYWYDEFMSFLLKNDFCTIPGINCMVTNQHMTLIFYVDDILITYYQSDAQAANNFEKLLSNVFEVRKVTENSSFLGVRIVRDRPAKKLWLCQDAYILSLAATFNIQLGKVQKSPLPQNQLLPFEGKATDAQIKGFQHKVGKASFASITTRPDIARAVSMLSRFLTNPGPKHHEAVDMLLHYLISTPYLSICYDGNYCQQKSRFTKRAFMTFSDASFADDPETRHSSCGFALMLYGGIVHYKATKQKTVTTSSTEAELLAVSYLAKEYLWWMRLFDGIELDLNHEAVISLDNKQTIRLITKESPKLVTKLKHVDIHQLWIRQECQAGRIKVEWVPKDQMVADGFTEELSPQKYKILFNRLVCKISHG